MLTLSSDYINNSKKVERVRIFSSFAASSLGSVKTSCQASKGESNSHLSSCGLKTLPSAWKRKRKHHSGLRTN